MANGFGNKQRRFIIVLIISVIFFSLLLISANIYIDPRGIFGTGEYPVLVATARVQKSSLLKSFNTKPKILIMGSSHCMRYSPEVIHRILGMRAFNLSVNSGKMEDFLVLLRYSIDELNIKPKMIIMGLCSRSFCLLENEGFDKRLTGNAVLMKYVPLNPLSKLWRKSKIYFETLNWNYLKDVKRSITIAGGNPTIMKYSFEPDGFLNTEENFNMKGRFLNRKIQKDCDVTAFSKERERYFTVFRNICKKNNIALKIVITPYAPEYIQQINLMDGSYDRLNRQLLDFLNNQNESNYYELYDFSSIDKFGGVDEFMGAAHPSIFNSSLILQRILEKNF
jgi:hypothetical protein